MNVAGVLNLVSLSPWLALTCFCLWVISRQLSQVAVKVLDVKRQTDLAQIDATKAIRLREIEKEQTLALAEQAAILGASDAGIVFVRGPTRPKRSSISSPGPRGP